MTTPETSSKEGVQIEPFVRVEVIDGEGRYMFALDPNVQFKKMYRWIACKTVPGERPIWEKQLFDLIKGSKDYSSEGEDHSRNYELWNEERGHFVFNNKVYGISFGKGCVDQRSIGNFAIADELFAKGIARGGALILDLERIDSEPTLAGEFLKWKGLILVKGQPGEAITNIIGVLNQQIQNNHYPLWKRRDLTVFV